VKVPEIPLPASSLTHLEKWGRNKRRYFSHPKYNWGIHCHKTWWMPKACKSSKSYHRYLWEKNPSRHNKKGQEVLDLHAVPGKGIPGSYHWMFVVTVPDAAT